MNQILSALNKCSFKKYQMRKWILNERITQNFKKPTDKNIKFAMSKQVTRYVLCSDCEAKNDHKILMYIEILFLPLIKRSVTSGLLLRGSGFKFKKKIVSDSGRPFPMLGWKLTGLSRKWPVTKALQNT